MILKMIRQECKEQKISLKRLCHGICDASFLSRCINKDIEIDKLMLESLLQRLGISTRRYTFILRDSEYSCFELREKARTHIWQGKPEQAQTCIDQYLTKENEMKSAKHLHHQVALLLRSYIMAEQRDSLETQLENVKTAMECTDAHLENLDFESRSYSEIELLLILRGGMILSQMNEAEKAFQIYEQLYSLQKRPPYVHNEFAHIFAKVNYQMAKHYLSTANYAKVMEISDYAIKMLADGNKILYMWELMKMYLDAKANSDNVHDFSENHEIFENYIALKSVVEEHYPKWNADTYCPMYYEYEIYSLRKMISQRRKLIGETQESISRKSYCDYATIERLERGLNDPQTVIRYQLLNAVGLPIEKCYYMLIADNMAVRRNYFEYINEIEKGNINIARELLEKVKQSVDLSITINKQAISLNEFELEKTVNQLALVTEIEKEIELLRETLPEQYLTLNDGGLLYGNEETIIRQLIKDYEKNGDLKEAIDLTSRVLNGYKKPQVIGDEFIGMYLGFSHILESLSANIGDFTTADLLTNENLCKCIQHDFAGLIIFWLYDILWNKEKQQKEIKKSDLYLLDVAILLAAIKGHHNRQAFFSHYKEKIIHNYKSSC